MRGRKLIWQLYPSYLAILLASLVVFTLYSSDAFRTYSLDRAAADLEARGRLLANQLRVVAVSGSGGNLQGFCRRAGEDTSTRLTLIDSSGTVLCDSDQDPAVMENHAGRPEIASALAGGVGRSVRYSYTLQENLMYVAMPLTGPSGGAAVLRTAIPVTSIDKTLRAIYRKIILGGVIVAVLAAALTLLVSQRITRPLNEMRRGAERFARGDLQQKLTVRGSEEIVGLSNAMNRMAAQLNDRMQAVTRQRNELEAVFASMIEGVLIVDHEALFIDMNKAAAELLEVRRRDIRGRSILEVIRNIELLRLVQKTLAAPEPVEGTIVVRHQYEEDRILQAHGTKLSGQNGRPIGALIVINDVSRLLKLENLRRDFVANVSHELKTPITAIKGFVETLLDGALEDRERAGHFLAVIQRQTNRLYAIVEDLLALSRIEQEAENDQIVLEDKDLVDVLRSAKEACSLKADQKEISVRLEEEGGLQARINAPLLEQAVVNLLDNAIKYSRRGGEVVLESEYAGNQCAIRVRDNGPGIPPEHLPRLFERFFLVDKARSRKLGGTGLGLAIVKHIAQAHGGRVGVESAPGSGSVFTIFLPASIAGSGRPGKRKTVGPVER